MTSHCAAHLWSLASTRNQKTKKRSTHLSLLGTRCGSGDVRPGSSFHRRRAGSGLLSPHEVSTFEDDLLLRQTPHHLQELRVLKLSRVVISDSVDNVLRRKRELATVVLSLRRRVAGCPPRSPRPSRPSSGCPPRGLWRSHNPRCQVLAGDSPRSGPPPSSPRSSPLDQRERAPTLPAETKKSIEHGEQPVARVGYGPASCDQQHRHAATSTRPWRLGTPGRTAAVAVQRLGAWIARVPEP